MFKKINMVLSPITKIKSNQLATACIGLVIFSVLLLGCTAVRKTVTAYQLCQEDPECLAQAQRFGDLTAYSTTTTLEDTPDMSGVAGLIGIGVGTLGTIIYKIVFGSQIERRKNVQNSKK